jgi:hypothetical protein
VDEVDKYFLFAAHAGMVGFHAYEISEAKAITLGLLIAAAYFIESSFEVRQFIRTWRKEHKSGGNDK